MVSLDDPSKEDTAKQDLTVIPEQSYDDFIHAGIRGTLTAVSIPGIGAPLAEWFSAIVVPPLEKRRDAWIRRIAIRLQELETNVGGLCIAKLPDYEAFITTMMYASQAAIRTHQAEKLEALQNIVLQAAMPNPPDEDIQLMFINFLDTMTSWHLIILKFLDAPEQWALEKGITFPSWSMCGIKTVIEFTFPELKHREEFLRQIVKALYSQGLINTDSIGVTMTASGATAPQTTKLGHQFIQYISSPIP